MKIGDLIMLKNPPSSHGSHVGLILEIGVYVGRKDIKVYWSGLKTIGVESSKWFEVIND